MTTEPSSPAPETGPDDAPAAATTSAPARRPPRFTRASAAWLATAVALLLLILLIVFILQNSTKVEIEFLGLDGTIPLGMALLIAAVGGGVVVAIAGVARVTQLRLGARRMRRDNSRAKSS